MDTTQMQQPRTQPVNTSRIEAYHLCESIIDIYENVFDDGHRLRSALVGALDYENGLIGMHDLAAHHRIASSVVYDTVTAAVNSDGETAWGIHPALMVAYAIQETLAMHVDLAEVQRRVDEALRYAGKKRRVH